VDGKLDLVRQPRNVLLRLSHCASLTLHGSLSPSAEQFIPEMNSKGPTLSSNPWHDMAARGIPQSELIVSFLLKTRQIADLTHIFGAGHMVAFPHSASFEAVNCKGNLKILWLNNHQTAIVQN
jgi:hypothetical protein